jgi:hypothetical protein
MEDHVQKADSKIVIKKARNCDVKEMLNLNYKIYPPEWHVDEEYVHKVLGKNPEVYNILYTEEGVKGIVSLFPLEKNIYESILKGEMDEADLSEYILDYSQPKDVYLYLISIIVDIYDINRKFYAKKLIQSIPKELERLNNKGINIKEIGAIAVSEEGEKILPKIGFKQDKEMLTLAQKNYPTFRTTVDKVINAIY